VLQRTANFFTKKSENTNLL